MEIENVADVGLNVKKENKTDHKNLEIEDIKNIKLPSTTPENKDQAMDGNNIVKELSIDSVVCVSTNVKQEPSETSDDISSKEKKMCDIIQSIKSEPQNRNDSSDNDDLNDSISFGPKEVIFDDSYDESSKKEELEKFSKKGRRKSSDSRHYRTHSVVDSGSDQAVTPQKRKDHHTTKESHKNRHSRSARERRDSSEEREKRGRSYSEKRKRDNDNEGSVKKESRNDSEKRKRNETSDDESRNHSEKRKRESSAERRNDKSARSNSEKRKKEESSERHDDQSPRPRNSSEKRKGKESLEEIDNNSSERSHSEKRNWDSSTEKFDEKSLKDHSEKKKGKSSHKDKSSKSRSQSEKRKRDSSNESSDAKSLSRSHSEKRKRESTVEISNDKSPRSNFKKPEREASLEITDDKSPRSHSEKRKRESSSERSADKLSPRSHSEKRKRESSSERSADKLSPRSHSEKRKRESSSERSDNKSSRSNSEKRNRETNNETSKKHSEKIDEKEAKDQNKDKAQKSNSKNRKSEPSEEKEVKIEKRREEKEIKENDEEKMNSREQKESHKYEDGEKESNNKTNHKNYRKKKDDSGRLEEDSCNRSDEVQSIGSETKTERSCSEKRKLDSRSNSSSPSKRPWRSPDKSKTSNLSNQERKKLKLDPECERLPLYTQHYETKEEETEVISREEAMDYMFMENEIAKKALGRVKGEVDICNTTKDDFVFFMGTSSPLSQFYPVSFYVDGIQYNCAEQYMMHQKAILFHDKASAQLIIKETTPSKQKKYGRQVQGFDSKVWEEKCKKIVKKGNINKFSQNPLLEEELCASYPKVLAEASPTDCIWGIGLEADDDKAYNILNWKGSNWLGFVLMEVRHRLMKDRRKREKKQLRRERSGESKLSDKDEKAKQEVASTSKGKGQSYTYISKNAMSECSDSSDSDSNENSTSSKVRQVKRKLELIEVPTTPKKLKRIETSSESSSPSPRKSARRFKEEKSPASYQKKTEVPKTKSPKKPSKLTQSVLIPKEKLVDNYLRNNELARNALNRIKDAIDIYNTNRKDFVFFFGKESPFSQFHPVIFTVDNITYNCAEQYMMHQKAVTFGDKDNGTRIMIETMPLKQKRLGRQVKNFLPHVWAKESLNVVRKGNIAKFSQNPDLREQLLATYPLILAESSPRDCLWGIGRGVSSEECCNISTWRGKNLLGFSLMEVRHYLMTNKEGL